MIILPHGYQHSLSAHLFPFVSPFFLFPSNFLCFSFLFSSLFPYFFQLSITSLPFSFLFFSFLSFPFFYCIFLHLSVSFLCPPILCISVISFPIPFLFSHFSLTAISERTLPFMFHAFTQSAPPSFSRFPMFTVNCFLLSFPVKGRVGPLATRCSSRVL